MTGQLENFFQQQWGASDPSTVSRQRTFSFTPGGGMGVGGQKPPGGENVVPPTLP